jgi:hypothetical protein
MFPRMLLSLLVGTVAASGSVFGCQSVLDAPDYRVVQHGAAARALIDRYASGSDDCAECLAGSACGDAFQRCTELDGCTELVACMLERPSPASETECVVRLEPTPGARDTAMKLSHCYADCFRECNGGTDFNCVGAYSYSGVIPSGEIRLTQTLEFLFAKGTPVEGLRVSVCRPGVSCDDPIASAETDALGTYSVEIPISTARVPDAGFRGYRLVHGEAGRLYPHRLQSSRPIMIDHVEQTGIASEDLTRLVLPLFGVDEGDAVNMVFLQVFDCRIVGADGIYFELDSPGATVQYLRGKGMWGDGPTLASQEGAAFVVGAEPGKYHEIRALNANGEIIASDSVYVPGDALVVSALFPKETE